MNRLHRLIAVAGVAVATFVSSAPAQVAQERVDLAVMQRIREEGLQRSHIAELAGYLTDVIGPRLTRLPRRIPVFWSNADPVLHVCITQVIVADQVSRLVGILALFDMRVGTL